MFLPSRARSAVAAVGAVAALGATAAVAPAAEPAGSCPADYELFLIPSDGSRPVAAAVDAKGNQDGLACQMPFNASAAQHVGAPYNVIDNRVAR